VQRLKIANVGKNVELLDFSDSASGSVKQNIHHGNLLGSSLLLGEHYWDLNSGPCACQAGALSLELDPQSFLISLCFK
jgi:hypothetical protein